MKEVVRVNLENEMDLIIAHKRTMKLAELCGLSLSSQTSFATAVSEIARCAIGHGTKSYLALGILPTKPGKKEIYASIVDGVEFWANNKEAITYATRLADSIEIIQTERDNEVRLGERINFGGTFTDIKIDTFIEYFKNEAPVSFYDEVRKKNIQLIDLSEKLRQSESQYRTLTDTLPLMMFSLSTAGEVIYSNRWLNNFFELLGQNTNFSWLEFLYPADRKSIVQLWEKAQQDKTVFRAQARLKQKSKDGFLWHLISIVPFKKENGTIASWTGFFCGCTCPKTGGGNAER
jgi:PAS domain-containing protein